MATFVNSSTSFVPIRFNPPPAATKSISAASDPPSQSDGPNDGISEWKQTGKIVQIVGFGGFGASLTLMVNAPSSAATHRALYVAYLSVAGLAITTSIGLSVFSFLFKGSPSVGWLQKKLIYFTLFFLVSACLLHLPFVLPLADIGIVMTLVMIGLVFILLYLLIGCRCQYKTYPETGEKECSVQVYE